MELLLILLAISAAIVLPPPRHGAYIGAVLAISIAADLFAPHPALRELVDAHRGVWWFALLVTLSGLLAVGVVEFSPALIRRVAACFSGTSPRHRSGW